MTTPPHAIGAYGGRLAKLNPTPTLDRLAKEGMLFENAFCTNSICTPSRASILTGQYAHTNGVFDLGGRIEPGRQALAIEFGKAGYETAMIGKWHLKVEPGDFDYYCVLPGQGKYHNPEFRIQGDKPWPKNVIKKDGMHSSDAITDIALDWFKNKRDKDKPFFVMHHYKAPHDYFEHAERYNDYLKDIDIPEPESLWSQSDFGSLATRGRRRRTGATHRHLHRQPQPPPILRHRPAAEVSPGLSRRSYDPSNLERGRDQAHGLQRLPEEVPCAA